MPQHGIIAGTTNQQGDAFENLLQVTRTFPLTPEFVPTLLSPELIMPSPRLTGRLSGRGSRASCSPEART
jgi:hypothetical protein